MSSNGITPGATEFTVISGAKAFASARVSMITPAFEAQYWACSAQRAIPVFLGDFERIETGEARGAVHEAVEPSEALFHLREHAADFGHALDPLIQRWCYS